MSSGEGCGGGPTWEPLSASHIGEGWGVHPPPKVYRPLTDYDVAGISH